jgi:mersacidin/lichenicidin family type 2 lantibiotic
MNIDIIRAWKDDIYRQGLSQEQQHMLPANPAGELELTCTELRSVYGGCGGQFPGETFSPAPLALSQAEVTTVNRRNFHSFAFFCQENVFSFNANAGHSFLSLVNNVCVNGDD